MFLINLVEPILYVKIEIVLTPLKYEMTPHGELCLEHPSFAYTHIITNKSRIYKQIMKQEMKRTKIVARTLRELILETQHLVNQN